MLNLLTPPELQITAGAYAVVGAAAMAAGVTRTISCAVMVFELTGQLNHMLPVLVAVLAAIGVGNLLNESIYDTMLELNNLPYLKPPPLLGGSVQRAQDVMDRELLALCRTCTYIDAAALVRVGLNEDIEFPVVDDPVRRMLLGSVRRSTLEYVLEKRLTHSSGGRSTQTGLHSSGSRPSWCSRLACFSTSGLPSHGGPSGEPSLKAYVSHSSPLRRGSFCFSLRGECLSGRPFQSIVGTSSASSTGGCCATGVAAPTTLVAVAGFAPAPAPESRKCMPLPSDSARLDSVADIAELEADFTKDELALMAMPLDLGLGVEAMSTGPETATLVNLAPCVIVAGTPLQQVHMHFSVFGLERAYVTFAGKLLGVIRRSHLGGD